MVKLVSRNLASEGRRELRNYVPGERWRIIKNIVVIGFAFMIHFTAFHGTANLQSSVNSDASLGTLTLAVIYGSLILSNIILPVMVISWLGCKWAIAISFAAYMPFIGAQFYPKIYTLLPAGLMVGFGGGPLWCAKCTYLTVVAEAYSEITGQASDMLVTRFFGFFYFFYQMAQVWETSYPLQVNPNLQPPSLHKLQLIAGIYLACMIVAALSVALGVDSLTRYSGKRVGPKGSVSSRLMATLRQTKEPYQLLLLPATVFIGAEQAFMAADFSASYVACAWGISRIGFVMICFGVFNAIAAIGAGSIVKITGRYPVMVAAMLLHISLIVALLYWNPSSDNTIVFFIMAALWGTSDAIWLVQVNALSGILFPGKEEAAYSNFRLWEATGSVMAYAYSPYLCTSTKLYVMLGLLLLGMVGYSIIELLEYKAKKGINLKKDFELVRDMKDHRIADTEE